MFWTETLIQKTLFGEDEYKSSSTVSQLIKFAEDAFPDADCNFHRYVAFLTHQDTQRFLRPLLVKEFGGIDNAKVPTLTWLENIGSFDTFARCTRNGQTPTKSTGGLTKRTTPSWYSQYCQSSRFGFMKEQSKMFWERYMGDIHCSVNARHPHEVFHHSDYGRLGEGDEFRYLIPLCHDCHLSVSARGPRVPSSIPEGVKQWL